MRDERKAIEARVCLSLGGEISDQAEGADQRRVSFNVRNDDTPLDFGDCGLADARALGDLSLCEAGALAEGSDDVRWADHFYRVLRRVLKIQ